MHNLIRIFNQNRKKIIWIILIIVFILLLIRLLDNLSRNKVNENIIIDNNTTENKIDGLVTEKSSVSGTTISKSKLKTDTDIINEFMNYCNNREMQKAYDLLTDECKELMFSTVDSFERIYYDGNFDGKKKSFTMENWIGNTYKINLTGDILSTGDLTNSENIQDYITVVENDNEYKLNINNYISRKKSDKTVEQNELKIKIESIDTYIDYEIYNLTIINDTDSFIYLGDCNDTKSIYLLDGYQMKYYFYGNEIAQNQLICSSNSKKSLKIKFPNNYSTTRRIESLVFSDVIFDYNKYKEVEDKENYEGKYSIKIGI